LYRTTNNALTERKLYELALAHVAICWSRRLIMGKGLKIFF